MTYEFCSYCGRKILPEDVLCPSCGASFKSAISSLPKNIRFSSPEDVWNEYLQLPFRNDIVIPLDKPVAVVSLLSYKLILSTEEWNSKSGKIFKFSEFGTTRVIPYVDLANIVENHPSFAENCFFCVMDKEFVNIHRLNEFYEKEMAKCLGKEAINQ